MTPEYILQQSLCRTPFCAGPYELRDIALKDWPEEAREGYRRSAQTQIEYLRYATTYGEPGYDDPKRGILFGDWNYFSREVGELLEKAGYELEWEDEWTTCDGCGCALRTQPNSYGWQPSYFESEGEYLCKECVDMEAFLESKEDDPRTALNDHIDPSEYGYTKLEGDFENGWHPGQNDDPQKIYERLAAAGHKRLLFMIDSVGQFDISFSIWEKTIEPTLCPDCGGSPLDETPHEDFCERAAH